jgi:hypothetical protein
MLHRVPYTYDIFMKQKPLVGQVLLIFEVSPSRSDTPHPVGLLWASGQPVVETST